LTRRVYHKLIEPNIIETNISNMKFIALLALVATTISVQGQEVTASTEVLTATPVTTAAVESAIPSDRRSLKIQEVPESEDFEEADFDEEDLEDDEEEDKENLEADEDFDEEDLEDDEDFDEEDADFDGEDIEDDDYLDEEDFDEDFDEENFEDENEFDQN
jgi:hypothetical protein